MIKALENIIFPCTKRMDKLMQEHKDTAITTRVLIESRGQKVASILVNHMRPPKEVT